VALDIPLRYFTSIRVANARGKTFLAGKWTQTKKRIVFEWSTKRVINDDEFPGNLRDGTLWTDPLEGSPQLVSMPSTREIGGSQDYREFDYEMLEDCLLDAPDWADRLHDDEAY